MVCVAQCADKLARQAFTTLATDLASTSRLLACRVLLLLVLVWRVGQRAGGRTVALVGGEGLRLRTLHVVGVRGLALDAVGARIVGLVLLGVGVLASQRRRAVAGRESTHGGGLPMLGVCAAIDRGGRGQSGGVWTRETGGGRVGCGGGERRRRRTRGGTAEVAAACVDEAVEGQGASAAVVLLREEGGEGRGRSAEPCPAVKAGQRCLGSFRRSVGSIRHRHRRAGDAGGEQRRGASRARRGRRTGALGRLRRGCEWQQTAGVRKSGGSRACVVQVYYGRGLRQARSRWGVEQKAAKLRRSIHRTLRATP